MLWVFDDVALVPPRTNVRPQDVTLQTRLTEGITLEHSPDSRPDADNVTESVMAIGDRASRGIGVIHKTCRWASRWRSAPGQAREATLVLNPSLFPRRKRCRSR